MILLIHESGLKRDASISNSLKPYRFVVGVVFSVCNLNCSANEEDIGFDYYEKGTSTNIIKKGQ